MFESFYVLLFDSVSIVISFPELLTTFIAKRVIFMHL